jgi:aminoglycoside phosphotransferase (APT) family kinase protein
MAAMDWNGIPLQVLDGGYSGETFLAGDPDENPGDAVVVRVYARSPERAAVDASLLQLLRGVVPVPEIVEFRPADGDLPPVLATRFVDGIRLDDLLAASLDDDQFEALGANLGWVLGSLSSIPFLRPGMFDGADLRLTGEGMPTDLAEWARHFRDTGRLAAWPQRDWEAVQELVEQAQRILDEEWTANPRVVLVHSDFNAKNIVIDPDDMGIAGVFDWEFAHAGSVHADLGNFTRFERDDRLIEPMIEGFVDRAPGHVRSPYVAGRAADLWALLELAGGGRLNAVRNLAAQLLLAQARTGDLDAWPWDRARVDPRTARQIS